MKFLVVGLGNPGPEYAATRHNIGFQVLDHLAGNAGVRFAVDRYGDRADLRLKGRTFVLIKPSTFMNLSGKTVRYWMDQEDIPADRVLVIADDLAIPFGAIRIRAKGGAGGHNGLTSIIELIGTEEFPRLRFGIGSDFSKGRQSDYVLSPWSAEEQKTLTERIELAAKAVLQFGLLGVASAMNNFNKR
ncbi:MAG: aminoacyl-tRNA hydrolase [Flavobacteriales bacterium]|nr:aminoacyl-tRNA hydrolase [Flavobacteriales bacterium]MCC6938240.1 aminoacyl-tRNA hydrolase [Flavobacteriales bacterium]